MNHHQSDLFTAVTPERAPWRARPVKSTNEIRRLVLERFAIQFSTSTLPGFLMPPHLVEDFEAYVEGSPNPKFDYRLRVSKMKIDHCHDSDLESFVRDIHAACLVENLKHLQSLDSGSSALREKAHILQWVFCVQDIDGVDQRKIVCSFHNCCVCSHVDPDELRALLLQREDVRELLVNLHLLTPSDLPPLRHKRTAVYDRSRATDAWTASGAFASWFPGALIPRTQAARRRFASLTE